ncbi:MAG: ABC transporter permease, partial [Gemmataceae bacterium]
MPLRWSIVRLLTTREIRDLLRDRRTVMLILVLPAILYPFFGLAGYFIAVSIAEQKTVIGLVGGEHLPTGKDSTTPPYPALIAGPKFAYDATSETEIGTVEVRPLSEATAAEALKNRVVDAVLVVPSGCAATIAASNKPTLTVQNRDADEKSKLAAKRLAVIVRKWEADVRKVRFERAKLPKDFDEVITLEDPSSKKPKEKKAADELRDQFVKIFPLILMMWLIAGAIQPAVDLTAGEKERGTMETLLISPAERIEIVAGKFLATTAFAFGSVLWNVLWLTAGCIALGQVFGFPIIYLPGLFGCVLLGIPLAMLFSAICLGLGI